MLVVSLSGMLILGEENGLSEYLRDVDSFLKKNK